MSDESRRAILVVVDSAEADGCPSTLFAAAEKECFEMMSDVFQGFRHTVEYRVCAWLCSTMDMGQLTLKSAHLPLP
jgi:hypothetical protein